MFMHLCVYGPDVRDTCYVKYWLGQINSTLDVIVCDSATVIGVCVGMCSMLFTVFTHSTDSQHRKRAVQINVTPF